MDWLAYAILDNPLSPSQGEKSRTVQRELEESKEILE
jgi:hypothetical protein